VTATTTPRLIPEMLLDPAVLEDPYPFYRQLVAEVPVWRIPGTDVVLVSSFDAVIEVVNRTGDFSRTSSGCSTATTTALPGLRRSIPVSRPSPPLIRPATPAIGVRSSPSLSPSAWPPSATRSASSPRAS